MLYFGQNLPASSAFWFVEKVQFLGSALGFPGCFLIFFFLLYSPGRKGFGSSVPWPLVEVHMVLVCVNLPDVFGVSFASFSWVSEVGSVVLGFNRCGC